jgi:hypothetical protein
MKFESMSKEQAIEYCYKHKWEYLKDIDSEDGDEFDCLVGLIEDEVIKPTDLPSYGMEYNEVQND